MSGGLACRDKKHQWVVTARECNYSAFNGYHWTPSAYSEVWCLDCRRHWRTRARYVIGLEDMSIVAAHDEREARMAGTGKQPLRAQ